MRDLRRISILAVVLIVLLRLSIGWQFLYEGIWKLRSMSTAEPWSAEGYLKNAQGPFRSFYHSLLGDPYDLNWLDPEWVERRWTQWYETFVRHYGLNERQQARLRQLLFGSKEFVAPLERLPEGVAFRGSLGKIVRFDPERKLLIVDGRYHLTPRERDRLLEMARPIQPPPGGKRTPEQEEENRIIAAYRKAVQDVYARATRNASARQSGVSIMERMRALLKGDPERVTVVNPEQQGTVDYKRIGKIELYKSLIEKYEKQLASAQTDFEFEHLKKLEQDIRQLHSELVGPIKALEKELVEEARKLLTDEQRARGPAPMPELPIDRINWQTIWALLIIGGLLIAGLATPLAAIAGAGLLMLFYLAMPPWPGVPEPPGPEHAFIVNKNFIEAVALLAIAAMPTGRWFGIDGIIHALWKLRRLRKQGVEV